MNELVLGSSRTQEEANGEVVDSDRPGGWGVGQPWPSSAALRGHAAV